MLPSGAGEGLDKDDLDALNPWMIDGRYPGDVPDVDPGQARALIESAQRVLAVVREAFPGEDARGEHDGHDGER